VRIVGLLSAAQINLMMIFQLLMIVELAACHVVIMRHLALVLMAFPGSLACPLQVLLLLSHPREPRVLRRRIYLLHLIDTSTRILTSFNVVCLQDVISGSCDCRR
jgi:hypothetical protein